MNINQWYVCVCVFFVPNLKIKEMSVKDIYLLSAASSLLSFRIALVQITRHQRIAIVRAGKMKKMILCNLSNQKSKLSVNLIFLGPPGINLSLSTTWTSYWFTISSHLITLKPHPLPNEGLGNCGLLSIQIMLAVHTMITSASNDIGDWWL